MVHAVPVEVIPTESFGDQQSPDGTHLGSVDGMSATSLAEAIRAELTARDMTWSAFMRKAKISQKTMQALRDGDEERVFGHTLLAKLDDVLGFERGHLYRIWKSQPRSPQLDEIATQMRMLEVKMAEMRERPPWYAEALDVLSRLSTEDREWVLSGARRLARRSPDR